jgi:hypothetical protein
LILELFLSAPYFGSIYLKDKRRLEHPATPEAGDGYGVITGGYPVGYMYII